MNPGENFESWSGETFGAQLAGDRAWWGELLIVMEAPARSYRLAPLQRGSVMRNRGLWHVRDYNMEAALASYGQALEMFRAVGSRLGEANTLQAIGDVQGFKKENEAALASYGQALEMFRAVGSRLGEANTLLAMADVVRDQEEWAKSRKLYEQTTQIYQAIGDNYSLARVHYRLGDWHAAQENRLEAAKCYQEAITIWSNIGLDNLVEQILLPRLQSVTD